MAWTDWEGGEEFSAHGSVHESKLLLYKGASQMQGSVQHFCEIFAKFLRNFCNIFAILLRDFGCICNIFAFFCKNGGNFAKISQKFRKIFAKISQKCCKNVAKRLQ